MQEGDNLEQQLGLVRFWVIAAGRWLNEASVLILVFGCLDQVEHSTPSSGKNIFCIAALSIAIFIGSGTMEWLGRKK